MAPNPLQPLLDEIHALVCAVKQLVTKLGGTSTDGKVVPIIIQPLKGETARIKTVTIKTTATLIVAKNTKRANISIVNGGAATVYVGPDTTVTSDTGGNPGYELLSQGVLDNDTYVGAIYGIVAVGTVVVKVWEEDT